MLFLGVIVGFYDALHQMMADNILNTKPNNGKTFDILKNFQAIYQAAG